MARQLDLDQLQCDEGDARLAVAFGYWGPSPGMDGWTACCADHLAAYQREGAVHAFVDVRFRDDPAAPTDTPNDTADHADDDPALKYGAGGADNNNS